MKKFTILIFTLLILKSYSQSIRQVDSVATKMCESLYNLKNVKDDIQVTMIFQKHLPGFYENLKVDSQEKADSIKNLIYYRLQKNCKPFTDILTILEPEKGDWANTAEKPKSSIKGKECHNLSHGGNFYYKESDGKIVNVFISNSIWEESFQDGTKSRLSFIQKNECQFTLSFIESNNEIRKNLSVKGDLYNYGLSSYTEKKYGIWVFAKNVYYTFILYER